jgi:ABC-2 type transport system permease protein
VSGLSTALEVARWEFLRFVKPKQQIVGMITTILIFGGVMLLTRMRSDDDRVRDVAVIGGDILPVTALSTDRLRLTEHSAREEETLRMRVRERWPHGLLIVRDTDHAELVVGRTGAWTGEVRALLTAARQQRMTEQTGLTPDAIAAMLSPPTLEVTSEQGSGDSRAERITLIIVVSLMLMTVFIGMSYIFVSITGDKQVRVTEQVLSAIPAQSWIDGKILGIAAVSLVGVAAQVVAFLIVVVVLQRFTGMARLPLPSTLGDPATVALMFAFALLGLGFWFGFFGAIAATIDDPNSSTRTSFLFLPMLTNGLAFVMLRDPDTPFARTLALLPPTAPAAMPVRLLAGEPTWLEVMLSLVLLAASAWLLRVVAGRIFRLAMLMYGKEPGWAEIRRWALRG